MSAVDNSLVNGKRAPSVAAIEYYDAMPMRRPHVASRQAGSRDGGVSASAFDTPRTLADGVAAHLREMISKGTLSPGARLNELRLARELSLSRSPIREAFRMLAVQGLVAITPRRGARVRPISLDELRDVFEMRSLFELYALGRSDRRNANEHAHMQGLLRHADALLERGDVEAWYESSQAFHDAIVDSAGNRQLKALYELIKLSMRRYQLMVIGLPKYPDRSQAEHQAIFDAFAAGDRSEASDLLRAHLKRVTDTLTAALKAGRTEAELRRQLRRGAGSPAARRRRG